MIYFLKTEVQICPESAFWQFKLDGSTTVAHISEMSNLNSPYAHVLDKSEEHDQCITTINYTTVNHD